MKKIVIVCGTIAGLIVSAMLVITLAIYKTSGDFENGMLIGYASMIIAFSLIFVGIKNYRDKYNEGLISFGKAFKIGFFITLIASTIYVIVWLIDYYFFIPDYGEKYAAKMIEKLRASGASQMEIAKQTKEMASFSEMYKNPFFNALITYTEILPVGLIVSLISSLILKRKSIVAVS
jgi:hypothetical protein